jgi:uncharacterized membrane protein YesL
MIHILWILLTIGGGIVLGFFPSTAALFAIMRDWIRGKTDQPVFPAYWRYYKKDFWKSNRLGIFMTAVGFLIGLDIWYIQTAPGEWFTWTRIPLFAFMLLFLLFWFYLFPAFVHFDLTVRQILKQAFLIMLISPVHTLLMLLCLAALFLVMYWVPATAFIFGSSGYAFITMWMCLHAFQRIRRNQIQ